MTYHCNTRKSRAGSGKKRTGQRDRKRKAGMKRSNGVSDVGKEEREGERKRVGERNEIHFYSSCQYKLAMYIFDSLGYKYCSTKQ